MEFEEQEEQGMEEEEEDGDEKELPPVGYHSSLVKIANSGGELGPATTTLVVAHQPTNTKPRYRECLKNHAVGLGGHSVDGCGEFMAAGAEGTLDALKCAACNCHRNFHRRDSAESPSPGGREIFFHGHPPPYPQPHHLQLPQFAAYYRTPAGYLHVAPQQQRPPLALPSTSGGGGAGDQSREDQEGVSNPSGGGGGGGGSSSRKRLRTKFTQEQKERMLGLAERLGWRMQKPDEAAVQQFCNETGVKRHVFKVWMHNNKHTLGKKP